MNMSSSFLSKFEVFVSYRGADTRTNFTSHLYSALTQKSIKTFIDQQLNRGDYIWPTLAKAIKESHVVLERAGEDTRMQKRGCYTCLL